MTKQQQTIWNRTEMHSGIRGATELLQQEVGQAGRAAMGPNAPLKLAATGCSSRELRSIAAEHRSGTSRSHKRTKPRRHDWNRVTGGAAPASYALITTLDGATSESVPVYIENREHDHRVLHQAARRRHGHRADGILWERHHSA